MELMIASIFTPLIDELTTRPVFWLMSLVMLISAIMVVSLKNVFHCALFLILCLFSVAGLFILLEAEFLAAAQVLIYVGAVAILMIFAIMLSSNLADKKIRQKSYNALSVAFATIIFAIGTIALLVITKTELHELWDNYRGTLPPDNIALLGKYLMTEYMLPFEVISVLLLAAMIGAIVLARKEHS